MIVEERRIVNFHSIEEKYDVEDTHIHPHPHPHTVSDIV